MDEPKPILNWVREDNWDVALTGAVLAGKLVRLQAEWPPWGGYMGPERFTILTSRSRFASGRVVLPLWADVDGPPRTHSVNAWQTGRIKRFGQQQRYYFTDAHRNRSGPLVVTNVKQYTTEPLFRLDAEGKAGFPAGVQGRLRAESGLAATKIMVGGTADPRVRVTIMTNNDSDPRNDLMPYLGPLISISTGTGRSLTYQYPRDRFLRVESDQWQPMFENGERELVLDVSEQRSAEVVIVPKRPYTEQFKPFMTGFAVRVEDVDDPEQFVISDVVTVEGGFHGGTSRPNYPEGSVLFRAR
jgi:hypothetical protein